MKSKTRSGQALPVFMGLFGVTVMIFFIAIILGVDTVEASHLGVAEKFGEIQFVQQPGIRWTGLFTRVHSYDMRTRKVIVTLDESNSAVDKTGQAVYAVINVNYKIKHSPETVQQLYSEVGLSDIVADTLNLDAIIAEAFKQTTVSYEALEILEKRQAVKEQTIETIKKNFPQKYFEIENIVVTNIRFSPAFENAIERKKVAEQEAIKEKNQLEVVKFQQQQEIEKYKAEAEKMRLQREQITPMLLQQAWIVKWNGQLPMTMLTSSEASNFLLQIPVAENQV